MNFATIDDRNHFFDTIIDNYKTDQELSIKMIQSLKMKHERDFLYYVYKNTNNPGLFSFVLDAIY